MQNQTVNNPLKVIPIILKSRVPIIFVWNWFSALSLLIARGGFPPIIPSILLLLSVFCIVFSVYIYNDAQDEIMDKENPVKKFRPIPSGLVKKEDIEKIAYLFGGIGLVLAWLVNIYSFVFLLAFFIIFFSYSYPKTRLKNKFLGKDFTLFIGTPLISLAANYAVSDTFSSLAFITSFFSAFLGLTVGPVVNESSDIIEDKKYGVKSISTMLNWKQKVQFMLFGIIVLTVLMPIIHIQYGANLILPIISIGLCMTLLILTYPLIQSYDRKKLWRSRTFTAAYFLIFPIQFVLLSLQVPVFF